MAQMNMVYRGVTRDNNVLVRSMDADIGVGEGLKYQVHLHWDDHLDENTELDLD